MNITNALALAVQSNIASSQIIIEDRKLINIKFINEYIQNKVKNKSKCVKLAKKQTKINSIKSEFNE